MVVVEVVDQPNTDLISVRMNFTKLKRSLLFFIMTPVHDSFPTSMFTPSY